MAGNQGINNGLRTIPPFNNIEPVEPFEVFQEKDVDVGMLLSESFVENVANGVLVDGGAQEEKIGDNNTNFLGREDTELHS